MQSNWQNIVYRITAFLFLAMSIWVIWLFIKRPDAGYVELSLSESLTVVIAVILFGAVLGYLTAEYIFRGRLQSNKFFARNARAFVSSGVAGAFIFGSYGLVLATAPLIMIKNEFDRFNVVEVSAKAAQASRLIITELQPASYSKTFGVTAWSRPPFDVHLCKYYGTGQGVTPERAKVYRFVDGKFALQNTEIRFSENWENFDEGNCLVKAVRIDAPAISHARYCMELDVRARGKLSTEKTCWDFIHETGEERLALTEILGQ